MTNTHFTKITFFLLLIACLKSQVSKAADLDIKFSELRISIYNLTFSDAPTALNNLTAADNVEKLQGLTAIGLEAEGRIQPWLKFGSRVRGVWNKVDSKTGASAGKAFTSVHQSSAGLTARFPIVEKEFVQFDIVTEVGLQNTEINIQTTSSGSGAFKKDGSLFQRAGASVGVGWSSFKFFIEAGQEWNKVSGLDFTGNLANSVTSVDFSGPYYSFGLIIQGIPSWIKPAAASTK